MATSVSTASIQSSNPVDGSMSPDPAKSSSNKNPTDKVTVALTEGKVVNDQRGFPLYLQLVLQISADSGASVSLDGKGGITIRATANTPRTQYVICDMNSTDPNNWTVKVGTSGGSTYQYVKGTGGGGHGETGDVAGAAKIEEGGSEPKGGGY